MSQSAIDTFSITRHAIDPRADGGRRTVHVSATIVSIDRTVGGVRMRVGVPMTAYRDLVICVRASSERATLKLRHDDSELNVEIGSGAALEVAKSARAWSTVIGKAIVIEDACVIVGRPYVRQRKRTKPSRRSSFARRRAHGALARMETSFAGEREIIART